MQGLNIMQFCKEYNAATQDKVGTVIPVEITCFEVRLQLRRLVNAICMAAMTSAVVQRFVDVAGLTLWGLSVQDRSFTFILKTPPASVLLQKAAGVQKGSGTPNSNKVGKVTRAQLRVSGSTICGRDHSLFGHSRTCLDVPQHIACHGSHGAQSFCLRICRGTMELMDIMPSAAGDCRDQDA